MTAAFRIIPRGVFFTALCGTDAAQPITRRVCRRLQTRRVIVVSYKAGDLWNWYDSGKTGSPVSGGTKYEGTNPNSMVTISGGSTYVKGDVVHAAILYVFTDGDGNKWCMENAADGTVGNFATTIDIRRQEALLIE